MTSEVIIHHREMELPKNNAYVLARYLRENGCSLNHQTEHMWAVVRCVKGISLEEREKMSDDVTEIDYGGNRVSRNKRYKVGDEYGNNQTPYCWEQYGPGTLFGQDVDYWCELPQIPKELK